MSPQKMKESVGVLGIILAWEVPQIIGTMAAMCISDFEIFAKNLFYTWGTKGFHQKKSLGCAKNSFSSDF